MKRRFITIALFAAFITGMLVLLYPTIADQWNSRTQSHAIADYEYVLEQMSIDRKNEVMRRAREYNAELAAIPFPFTNYDEAGDYDSILNLAGNGLIGHISIPLINVELPIYHGCGEAVLSTSVGHLEGTSFPVGGENTHAVVTAHRGLPSARLFTDLDKLSEGDYFTVTVMDELLTYRVDKISVVLPHEMDSLRVIEGGDYMTLVTCTPYGINSHRLLVRGVRTENISGQSVAHVAPQAYLIEPMIVAPVAAIPMIVAFVLLVIFKPVEKDDPEGDEIE